MKNLYTLSKKGLRFNECQKLLVANEKSKKFLIEKKRISIEWQNKETMYSSEEFIAAIYKIKDLDRQIDQALANLEKKEA